MKAYVIRADKPISKPGPMQGLMPRYWTTHGVTLFIFEHDNWIPGAEALEPAQPGMVGFNITASAMYLVLDDGEVYQITNLGDEVAKLHMNAMLTVDQRNAEILLAEEDERAGRSS